MKTLKFKTNINCNSCVGAVTPFLNAVDDIDSWKVDIEHPDKILDVETDLDAKKVIEVVNKAGYKAEEIDG